MKTPAKNTIRAFLLLLVVAGCGLWATGCRRQEPQPVIIYGTPAGRADPAIQHVILISVDTLRADHLSCYGNPMVKTPHIDKLASEGMLFEMHLNSAPTTLNSHTSLMTGTWPHTHGVPRNGFLLSNRNAMLAEMLKEHGFSTAAFIGAFPLHSRFNFDQGFDHYDEKFAIFRGKAQVDQDQRRAEQVTDAVVDWLDSHHPERLFLFVHYFDPHWPYDPPTPYDGMYRQDDQPFSGSLMEIRLVRQTLHKDRDSMGWQNAALNALYSGEITYADHHLGRLWDALRERGLYDNSLIVLTADHGEAMNEHWEIWDHGHSTYQTTVRTPLIIRQPGGRLGGERYDHLVSNIDVMPTILDRLGIGHPEQIEGVSFAPLLDGEPMPARDAVFSEATKPFNFEDDPHWRNTLKCRAVCDGRWKFIYRPMGMVKELYDLESDPEEKINKLKNPDAEILSRSDELFALLHAWTQSARPLEAEADESDETLRKLKDLGYIQDE
jgi:arylsulfatase A-like enzyme